MTARSDNFEVGRGADNTNAANLACPTHRFGSDTDTMAVIATDGYFDEILALEIAQDNVRIGDIINMTDSLGIAQIARVTAVSPTMTITIFSGSQFTHEIAFAGFKTSEGGSTTEFFAGPGVWTSDRTFVTMKVLGGAPVTIIQSSSSTNGFDVRFSANPAADHQMNFIIIRAV